MHYWSSLAVRAQDSGIVEGERTTGPAPREGPYVGAPLRHA
ncbi:hypothetical protein ACWFR5_31650 [Streptomyces sp. NPDC055092]